MPDLRDRLATVGREWFCYVRTVVLKAPRERPDLLLIVLLAAVIVILLYAIVAIQRV